MENINESNILLQEGENIKKVTVFRFEYSLAPGIKNRLKLQGCNWNSMLHGWIYPLSRQKAIQSCIETAHLKYDMHVQSLPASVIPVNSQIANAENQLNILEEKYFKEDR